jgi:Zn-finger nucleic acid-binding protein
MIGDDAVAIKNGPGPIQTGGFTMKCPVCNTVNLVMSDRQGVEIDYCPECRGVWLDRGELDKIIARSAEQPDSRAQSVPAPLQQPYSPPQEQQYRPQEQHYNQGHGYQQSHDQKPYRKKSFMEELFD